MQIADQALPFLNYPENTMIMGTLNKKITKNYYPNRKNYFLSPLNFK